MTYSYVLAALASRLLRCVFSGLTLPDLMQIFSGNAQPVDGLRSSLQALVREAILHEAEPTDENIAQGVETVIAEFQADIDDSCVSFFLYSHCIVPFELQVQQCFL